MSVEALLPYPARLLPPAGARRHAGKRLREQLPRSCHATWKTTPDRPDPIDLLRHTDRGRLPSLIPIRYGRMLPSPVAFLRGAAVLMANDLSRTPTTGITTQLCGDAHLDNFGGYATPERALIFDLNDFDETLVGPWEWDVKRLAASTVVAGRVNGLSDHDCRAAARAAVRSYREHMHAYAAMRFIEIWYSAIDATEVVDRLSTPAVADAVLIKARRNGNPETLPRLAEPVSDGYRIVDEPPLVTHRTYPLKQRIADVWAGYRASLPEDRRVLLDRYRLVDVARKVVGVGSVGLRCFVALLLGNDDEDPLFLQFKEARPSVLLPFARPSPYANQGKRVASGQRVMQAASDVFLGWTRCGPVDYYVRQLRDMKASIPTDRLDAGDLAAYAALCGWALARAHACSGDPARIGGYLGTGDAFDRAIGEFAVAYADQIERDHAALVRAVNAGRVAAERGV